MNILKKISVITSIMGIIAALGMPVFVTAQTSPAATTNTTAVPTGTSEFGAPINGTYTLLEPLPCIAGTGNNCAVGSSVSSSSINIQTYIVYVFKLMIALAVLAAVVMCIVGGFQYMLTDSVSKKLDAKGTIQNAILGLAGALGSYLILYAINPNLVNVSLVTVPKLNVTTTTINTTPTTIDSSTDATVAAMDRAANAKDQALAQQVTTDETNEQNLADQFAACTPPDSAACQAIYDQYIAAQSTTNTDTGIAAVSYSEDSDASEIANMAKYTTPAQFAEGVTNVQNAANLEIAQLPNDDLTDKQTIINQENLAIETIQNQSAVTSFQNTSQGQTSENAAINAITANANAARTTTTDPAVLQQITANEISQQNAVRALAAPTSNGQSLTPSTL